MRKSLIAVLLILASVGILPAALHVYQVPDLAGGNEKPSIARNAQGDILIVYRNNIGGAAYYFKRHDGGTLGPEIIAGQTYEPLAKKNILVTDIVADPAGNFHAVWNFDIHKGAWGMYCAVFDIATERWRAPTRIVSGKVEAPRLTINPLTNDLVVAYDSFLRSINKDVFIKVKTSAGWKKEVDLSFRTQEAARPSDWRAALAPRAGDDWTGLQAPHGQLAETNAWVAVDESDGYVYVTWKADKWNNALSKWELQIVVALLDPSYNMVWFGRVTHDYEGFHFLPTIAAIDGQSMMAHAWQQEAGYYYINFVRNGNALVYNPSVLNDHRIAECPLHPHYEFFSYVVGHGDEMMFVYKDPDKRTNLLRFTPDGKRLDKLPIDLCNSEPSRWPIDVFSALEVGLLTVWAAPREGDASIHYSIYDYPIIKISGKVKQDSKGVSGVTMTGLPGNPTTDSSGNYSTSVEKGWTGMVIPNKFGYSFSPSSRKYVNVTSAQEGQDYKAIGFSKISGKVQQDSKGVSGVTLTGLPGNPTTDRSGIYSTDVENGWMGTVIPNKSGYRFLPSSREYINVTSAQAEQNYRAIKQFNLTITATSGGTTAPQPATYPKDMNSRVTVRGNPDSNYRFDKWTGDASGSSNPMTLTIDRDKTIRANFIKQFNLTITATSGGTTTPPPATYPYDLNSSVTVTAIPDLNYRFDKWEVDGVASGSVNPMTLPIDKSKTIRANFIRIKSAANLKVEKRVERGFFSGYTLNALTWEANPENAEMGLTVSAQRVYRKARAEDKTKWARIVELTGTVLKYDDRNVPSDSDYVYAVVNVDDMGNESAIY